MQVFHLYIVLGIQNLLCVRVHDARFYDTDGSCRVRNNRLRLFSAKCGRLSMAMEQFFGSWIDCRLRLYLCYLLFPL